MKSFKKYKIFWDIKNCFYYIYIYFFFGGGTFFQNFLKDLLTISVFIQQNVTSTTLLFFQLLNAREH